MQIRSALLATCAAAALSLTLGMGSAAAIPLANTPITVGPISSGGNTFSNIGCVLTFGGTLAFPNNCNEIQATTTGGNLNIASGFTAAFGAFDDALITYTVTSATPITEVDLNFNGSFLGLAISSVTETIWTDATKSTLVRQLEVSCSILGCDRSEVIPLGAGYSSLYVEKDINVSATALGGAQISTIGQSFHSTPVPEPASLALFGMGLLGLGLAKRRQAAKAA